MVTTFLTLGSPDASLIPGLLNTVPGSVYVPTLPVYVIDLNRQPSLLDPAAIAVSVLSAATRRAPPGGNSSPANSAGSGQPVTGIPGLFVPNTPTVGGPIVPIVDITPLLPGNGPGSPPPLLAPVGIVVTDPLLQPPVGTLFPPTGRLIPGTIANDLLEGGTGNDTIDGGRGNDTLIGGGGDDVLQGGVGNDVYILDGLGNDRIVEVFSGGIDTIQSAQLVTSLRSYAHIERLELLGSINSRAEGTDRNDTLIGNVGDNTLDGGDGADQMTGGGGADVFLYTVTSGTSRFTGVDVISDFDTDDRIDIDGTLSLTTIRLGNGSRVGRGEVEYNRTGNDVFVSIGTDDRLGADIRIQLIGLGARPLSPVLALDDNAVVLLATQGFAVAPVQGSVTDNVLLGGTSRDGLFGLGGQDRLEGLEGDDVLNGGSADDTLIGGDGNDELLGGAGSDQLEGNAGNDTLDGGSGADTLTGGDGNDRYIVDAADLVIEEDGAGIDMIVVRDASALYLLPEHVENAIAFAAPSTRTPASNVSIFGNTLDNELTGNAGDNVLLGSDGTDTIGGGDGNDRLSGDGGNDSLTGGKGQDTLVGGDGDDTLDGGMGTDVLAGGTGNDVFLFKPTIGMPGQMIVTIDDFSPDDLIQVQDASLRADITDGDGRNVTRFAIEVTNDSVAATTTLHIGIDNRVRGDPTAELLIHLEGVFVAADFAVTGQFIAFV